ncbi:Chloroperoxidase [Infundibulicybe gibba]|nr:Chloroperoxidase [Infundibulicybe gibba]
MSLPPNHPKVDKHEHHGKSCPVVGNTHEWCPPQKGDSRSPCPALNTLANHGYIARDGKNLGVMELIKGLKACYNLSTFLATFLVIGGFVLLKRMKRVSLEEIGKHGAIEHDASLVHRDTPQGEPIAPIDIQPELVNELISDADTGIDHGEKGTGKILMNAADVARARVRREKDSPPLDAVHAEIARGEMGIILGVWETRDGNNVGIPVEWMRDWIGHERMPKDWRADHVQGLFDVVKRSKAIRTAMDSLKKNEPGSLRSSLEEKSYLL